MIVCVCVCACVRAYVCVRMWVCVCMYVCGTCMRVVYCVLCLRFSYYQNVGIKCADNSKLTRKQLNKLACRLTKAYGLNIGNDESIGLCSLLC